MAKTLRLSPCRSVVRDFERGHDWAWCKCCGEWGIGTDGRITRIERNWNV